MNMQVNNNDPILDNPLSEINGIDESQAKTLSMLENVFGQDNSLRMAVLFKTMQDIPTDSQEYSNFSPVVLGEDMQELNISHLSSGVQQWIPIINEICAGYPEVSSPVMARIVHVESRGRVRAKARTSSASGLTQITNIAFKQYLQNTNLNASQVDRFDPRTNIEIAANLLTQGLSHEFTQNYLQTHPERRGFVSYLCHHDGPGGARQMLRFLDKANGNLNENFWNENRSMLPSFHSNYKYTMKVLRLALTVNGPDTDEDLQVLTNTRIKVTGLTSVQRLSTEEYMAETPGELNQDAAFWISNFNIIGDSNAVGLTNVAFRQTHEKETNLSKGGAQSEYIRRHKIENLRQNPRASTVICCGYNDMANLGIVPTEQRINKEANDYIDLIDQVYQNAVETGTKVIVMIPHTFIPTKKKHPSTEMQNRYQNKLIELINSRGYNANILRVINNSGLHAPLHPNETIKRAWMARIQQVHEELNPDIPQRPDEPIESSDHQLEAPNETREQTGNPQSSGGSDDSGSSSGSGDEE